MNISNIFESRGLLYDRYLGDSIELPYSFEDIKIQPNEIATSDIINSKLLKLYENILYLYKYSKIASNIIPISATATFGLSSTIDTNLTWKRGLSANEFYSFSGRGYNNIDNTTIISVQNNKNKDEYTMFLSNSGSISTIISNFYNTFGSLTFQSDASYSDSGVLFNNIVAISFNSLNNMFILDKGLNYLFKYDVAGFLTDDNIYKNIPIFIKSIGGYGSTRDKTEFNSPEGITIFNDNVFVLDSGNKTIKKYDSNLNWITSYRLFTDFLSSYPMNISCDNAGKIYVLTNDKKIFVYSDNFQVKEEVTINTQAGEVLRNIFFSKTNSNIFYIVTSKNIYKRFVSKPNINIGKYLFYRVKVDSNQVIKSAESINVNGREHVFIFLWYNNVGKIALVHDSINLYDVLSVNDFDVYSFDEIKINKEEYLQNWVFNKALSKFCIINMRLRDQIKGKFVASKDNYNNLVFNGARYLLPEEYSSISFEQDITYFTGMNEILQNNIVNRSLEKIYNDQESMLNILKDDVSYGPLDSDIVRIG